MITGRNQKSEYRKRSDTERIFAKESGSRVATIQTLSDYSNDTICYKYLYDIYKNDTHYAGSGSHIVTILTTDGRGFATHSLFNYRYKFPVYDTDTFYYVWIVFISVILMGYRK